MTDPFGCDVQISGLQRAHRRVRFFGRLCAPAGALGGGLSTAVGIRSKITKHRFDVCARLSSSAMLRLRRAWCFENEPTDRSNLRAQGSAMPPALWPIGSLTIVPTRFVDEGLTMSYQSFSCANRPASVRCAQCP
jgi:hypothetical protein